MASARFDCPECGVVATRRHNFIRHLTAAHGIDPLEAEQLALRRGTVTGPVPGGASSGRYVTAGHLRSVALLEDCSSARETILGFRNALGGVDVLLRPVDAGLTVMSLDVDRCDSMISVGAKNAGGLLRTLPPSVDQISSMVFAYARKRDALARASVEERFSLTLIAEALAGDLLLGASQWMFVAHEWRLPLASGSTGKIDLLAFDPGTRRLIVIELKASRTLTAKTDKNGWDADRQAAGYADAIWQGRSELYPFFDRLIAAQAQIYLTGIEVQMIDPAARPGTAVWWPGSPDDSPGESDKAEPSE